MKVKKIHIAFFFIYGFQPVKSDALQQGPVAVASYPSFLTEPVLGISKDSVTPKGRDTSFNHIDTKIKVAALRLKQKTAMAKEYLTANGFNTDVCFMVDMSIPSGKNRFFVYNFIKNES